MSSSKLSISEALDKAIIAHRAKRFKEAKSYYVAILNDLPQHPEANHNMGILTVETNSVSSGLPFFLRAVKSDPEEPRYWKSVVDILIALAKFEEARFLLSGSSFPVQEVPLYRELLEKIHTAERSHDDQLSKDNPDTVELNNLYMLFDAKKINEALLEVSRLLEEYPKSYFLYNFQGALFVSQKNFDKAIFSYQEALKIDPKNPEICTNLGNAFYAKGAAAEALKLYDVALNFDNTYYKAHNSKGIAHSSIGEIQKAIVHFNKSLEINPNYANAYLNLAGSVSESQKSIENLEACLEIDSGFVTAQLLLCALQYFAGNKSSFDHLVKTPLKRHPIMRSLIWCADLDYTPKLLINRWDFFDYVTSCSIQDRPFYEFGVWRGEAFKYLINTYKTGYGFDTFQGLPETWHSQPKAAYSSDGNVPKITGGQFVVGKFEDTLPKFFEKQRPMAALINFDADLYSSTICALENCESIIDENTILVFDEFLINSSWELDEYKALNEFCENNNLRYEVVAFSFFTKQVAVKVSQKKNSLRRPSA